MPRKLVQDGYRGWYGYESRYDTAIRNSLSKLFNQNARAGLVKHSHKKTIKELEEQEKAFEMKQMKEKRDTQMELVEMRAYSRIYRQYSFTAHCKEEQKKEEKEKVEAEAIRKKKEQAKRDTENLIEANTDSESIDLKMENESNKHKGKRMKNKKGVQKVETAVRNAVRDENKIKPQTVDDTRSPGVVNLQSLSEGNVFKVSDEEVAVFGRSKSDLGSLKSGNSENKFTYKAKIPEIRFNMESVESPHPEVMETNNAKYIPSSGYGTLQNLFMTEPIPEEDEKDLSDLESEGISDLGSKSPETIPESEAPSGKHNYFDAQSPHLLGVEHSEEYGLEHKRNSVATANNWKLGLFRSYTFNARNNTGDTSSLSKQNGSVGCAGRAKLQRPKLWELPLTRTDRKSRVFPESCRNAFRLRRMMAEKAGRLIKDWAPENVRKKKARQILDKMSLPDLVQREKPTSAIFREFKQCKETHGSLDQYHHVNNEGRQGFMPRIDVLKIHECT